LRFDFPLKRFLSERFLSERSLSERVLSERFLSKCFLSDRFLSERFLSERFLSERFLRDRFLSERFSSERTNERANERTNDDDIESERLRKPTWIWQCWGSWRVLGVKLGEDGASCGQNGAKTGRKGAKIIPRSPLNSSEERLGGQAGPRWRRDGAKLGHGSAPVRKLEENDRINRTPTERGDQHSYKIVVFSLGVWKTQPRFQRP